MMTISCCQRTTISSSTLITTFPHQVHANLPYLHRPSSHNVSQNTGWIDVRTMTIHQFSTNTLTGRKRGTIAHQLAYNGNLSILLHSEFGCYGHYTHRITWQRTSLPPCFLCLSSVIQIPSLSLELQPRSRLPTPTTSVCRLQRTRPLDSAFLLLDI